MKYMLTAGRFCKRRELKNISKLSDNEIAEDFRNEIMRKRHINMRATLGTLTNFIIDDLLKTTGLLYQKTNEIVLMKVQHLFWEWKKEGLINEFEDFSDATKSWIKVYA